MICGDRRYTYAELDDWSSIIANGLARLGVARGQRVALFLPNIPEFVAAYLGIQKLGAVAVSLNTSLRAEETTFILQDSGAVAVFTTEQLRSSVDKQAATSVEHVIIAEGAAGGEDIALSELTAGASPEILAEVMDRDDPSAILYTSGTTGKPKGACLSHGNVISNMHSFNHNCGVRPDDRLLLFLPLFHCFGQNAILNNGLNACATLVMHREFHPVTIVRSIIEDQVTMFFGVPTTFIPIYKQAAASDLSSVRYYFSAAAPLPREIARKWQEKYQRVINEGYGLTETSPFASYNHLHWYKIGSIGALIENVEMRVVDVETGVEVPTGESGEIVIRGPNVMLGYWNRPEATEKAIRNGWFHTGDIGRVDQDGYFYIVDRLKDMINVGGLKVYPIEVENAIYQHPAVEDVAVYGVSDPLMGERSCANIVRKAGHEADEAEIRAFCRQQLADYKIPSDIRFVDSIPKSPTGKILKRVMRIQERKPAAVPVRPVVAWEIEEWIRYWLAENLQIEGDAVAAETSFFDLGMTSLLGLKLSQQLGEWLGVALEDVVVWNHGALGSLVNHAAQLVEAAVAAPSDQTGELEKAAAPPAAALEPEPPPDYDELEGLDAGEVARLLAEALRPGNRPEPA